jgi:hypothetical protein
MKKNPFPGMNPYLEQRELWHQVHNWLIIGIARSLTAQIAPKYRASIEERIYTSTENDLELIGIADVAAKKQGNSNTTTNTTTVTAQLQTPVQVRLPMPEEVTERYLEIKSVETKEVITVIEILSPKNKRSGKGRKAYESKRQKILGSLTHFVEIDLLRQGEPLPILGTIGKRYRILVSRSYKRPNADLYTFDLQDAISMIPIPLRKGEPEPVLDLQQILNQVYEEGRFDLEIDYSQPLQPALSEEDAAWVNSIVTNPDA